MLKKSCCLWLLLCSLLLIVPASAGFSERRTNAETGYEMRMEDRAGIIDESAGLTEELWKQLEEISQYGNAAILTVEENSDSTSALARETYHSWYGNDSGILCLIDLDNREIYIFSDGKIYSTITKSYANTITDNSYAYASDGAYGQCLLEMTGEIAAKLAGSRIAQPMRYLSALFLAILAGLLLTYILAKLMNSTDLSDEKDLIASISVRQELKDPRRQLVRRRISVKSSDSSGSSGGGGGGGSSGGGGGHGF